MNNCDFLIRYDEFSTLHALFLHKDIDSILESFRSFVLSLLLFTPNINSFKSKYNRVKLCYENDVLYRSKNIVELSTLLYQTFKDYYDTKRELVLIASQDPNSSSDQVYIGISNEEFDTVESGQNNVMYVDTNDYLFSVLDEEMFTNGIDTINKFLSTLGIEIVVNQVSDVYFYGYRFYENYPLVPLINPLKYPKLEPSDTAMYKLYQEQKLVDFDIKLIDGSDKVHKTILYLRGGDYFRKFFDSPFKQSNTTTLNITKSTFNVYIKFLYLGYESLDNEINIDIYPLLMLANYLDNQPLLTFILNTLNQTAMSNDIENLIELNKQYPNKYLSKLIQFLSDL